MDTLKSIGAKQNINIPEEYKWLYQSGFRKIGNKGEIHVESEIDKLDDAMEKLKKWKKSDVVELEITETGETVGTKGENLVKIVISSDGGMLSAYPIK